MYKFILFKKGKKFKLIHDYDINFTNKIKDSGFKEIDRISYPALNKSNVIDIYNVIIDLISKGTIESNVVVKYTDSITFGSVGGYDIVPSINDLHFGVDCYCVIDNKIVKGKYAYQMMVITDEAPYGVHFTKSSNIYTSLYMLKTAYTAKFDNIESKIEELKTEKDNITDILSSILLIAED